MLIALELVEYELELIRSATSYIVKVCHVPRSLKISQVDDGIERTQLTARSGNVGRRST